MSTDESNARNQARAQYESICEMLEAVLTADENGDSEATEMAEQAIREDPLSVQVRSGWISLSDKMEAEEYEILLCTGGPACRIIGDLNQYGEAETARLEYQDWGTPWTEYGPADEDMLLKYADYFLGA